MTDTPTQTDDSIESNADRSRSRTGSPDGGDSGLGSGRVRQFLAWAGLAICSLLAFVALIQFYWSVTAAIDLWVEPRHQPLIHAAFNLVVMFGSLIGISLLVRELSE
ncbi:hypothetical protein [Natrarchaeobius chitinivorans]|uniref:DUF8060 domain-containing protein n=1 Tax=Natrarchaeobius chitinivorans TaxID=1679083 RepID=A0A3N6M021_NATCH|nr:hypothetical protein [Natrarchaeobius chitinivorans]RQG96553.1 hypothetical protein EA473_05430 [Natrarchaeobius chitinivorans]